MTRAVKHPTNAERIKQALEKRPHSRVELEQVLGLGQVSVEQALRKLRKKVPVYTVQSTRTNVVYEIAKKAVNHGI